MPVVRLDFHYSTSALFRQTPSGSGKWGEYTFTTEPIENPDYLVVANFPYREIDVKIPENAAYLLSQEPPINHYRWVTKYFDYFDYVFTSWGKEYSQKVVPHQGMLPWHIQKSYDELIALHPETLDKKDQVSWITSNLRNRSGHRRRMKFLQAIRKQGFEFDLFGRGFQPVDDKFDALASYKYSIALENFSCNDYWTEKIADSLLSWSMPIYWGCKNITKYFPEEALILIDPSKPAEAIMQINQAIEDKKWEKNLDAIAEARDRILNNYQLFPGIVQHIERSVAPKSEPRALHIPKAIVPEQGIFDKFIGFLIRKF